MFKLTALIIGLATGDVSMFTNRVEFDTEAACMNYFDTNEGKASKFALEQMVAADSDNQYRIEFKCVAKPAGDPV